MSRPELYRDDVWHAPFRELRAQAAASIGASNSGFGPYWSIASYKPIVQVESLPDTLLVRGRRHHASPIMQEGDIKMPMFIAMDRPKHTGQRRTVAPAFTPSEMVRMTDNIRARTAEILDSLPVGTRVRLGRTRSRSS